MGGDWSGQRDGVDGNVEMTNFHSIQHTCDLTLGQGYSPFRTNVMPVMMMPLSSF